MAQGVYQLVGATPTALRLSFRPLRGSRGPDGLDLPGPEPKSRGHLWWRAPLAGSFETASQRDGGDACKLEHVLTYGKRRLPRMAASTRSENENGRVPRRQWWWPSPVVAAASGGRWPWPQRPRAPGFWWLTTAWAWRGRTPGAPVADAGGRDSGCRRGGHRGGRRHLQNGVGRAPHCHVVLRQVGPHRRRRGGGGDPARAHALQHV